MSPIEAVQAWMDGEFGFGDEPAMLEAIRKDKQITCSDNRIEKLIYDAMEEELDAAACLERMTSAK